MAESDAKRPASKIRTTPPAVQVFDISKILEIFEQTKFVGFDRRAVRNGVVSGLDAGEFSPNDVASLLAAYVNVGNNSSSLSKRLQAAGSQFHEVATKIIQRTNVNSDGKQSIARVAMAFPNTLLHLRKSLQARGFLRSQFGTSDEAKNLSLCDPALWGFFEGENDEFMWKFHCALNDAKKKPLETDANKRDFEKWKNIAYGGGSGIAVNSYESFDKAFQADSNY
jgi:hypothetical protein